MCRRRNISRHDIDDTSPCTRLAAAGESVDDVRQHEDQDDTDDGDPDAAESPTAEPGCRKGDQRERQDHRDEDRERLGYPEELADGVVEDGQGRLAQLRAALDLRGAEMRHGLGDQSVDRCEERTRRAHAHSFSRVIGLGP